MSHCHSGSCSSSSHSHGSHGSCGCPCHQQQSSCGSDCKCGCHSHHEGDFAHELLEMADEAWMCLLKDKIKQKIEALSGSHLNELADIVATSNHKRWVDKIASKEASEDYEDRVADFFNRPS